MTPHILKLKILHARQQSLLSLGRDIQASRPLPYESELTEVIAEERDAIQAAILALQREREAISAYCGEK